MTESRAKKVNDLQEAGYQAGLAGLPCEAPTSRELDRGSWEQGWRAGNAERKATPAKLFRHEDLPGHVAIFNGRKYVVGMLSNTIPVTYTIQTHLGEFGNSFDAEKAWEAANA